MPSGCTSSSCVTQLGGTALSQPDEVTVDGSGNVYVSDFGDNAIKEMPAGCTSSSCVTTLGGGFSFPDGVAVDAAGNVYVGDLNNGAVKLIPPGCTSPSCVTVLSTGITDPTGVALDGSGNVYVAPFFSGSTTVSEIKRADGPGGFGVCQHVCGQRERGQSEDGDDQQHRQCCADV